MRSFLAWVQYRLHVSGCHDCAEGAVWLPEEGRHIWPGRVAEALLGSVLTRVL